MYVVTGAAGFIGSNIVRGLNKQGISDVLAVDHLHLAQNFRNLRNCDIADHLDKAELLVALERGRLGRGVTAVIHQGACTNTMETDGAYVMENNYEYSKRLLDYAMRFEIPFIYASSAAVYGSSQTFTEDPANERPLNVYGYSKLQFDRYVRRCLANQAPAPIVGLRYYNVYGPHEAHKGPMMSVIRQLWFQLGESGTVRLFEGTGGFAHGEQKRDFVFVDDIVTLNLHFLEGGETRSGIYNAGTGQARSFNDVARILITLRGSGQIEYFPLPPNLLGKYQSFTQADLTALREAGYDASFTSLEDGIAKYHQDLQAEATVSDSSTP